MTDNDNEYITIDDAAQIIRVSYRHAARFAGRVRTRKVGKRILFHKGDVEALSVELGAQYKTEIPKPAELVPLGIMMETFKQQQQQIAMLSREVGRLEGLLESHRAMLADVQEVRQQLTVVEAERDRLLQENEQLRNQLDNRS